MTATILSLIGAVCGIGAFWLVTTNRTTPVSTLFLGLNLAGAVLILGSMAIGGFNWGAAAINLFYGALSLKALILSHISRSKVICRINPLETAP